LILESNSEPGVHEVQAWIRARIADGTTRSGIVQGLLREVDRTVRDANRPVREVPVDDDSEKVIDNDVRDESSERGSAHVGEVQRGQRGTTGDSGGSESRPLSDRGEVDEEPPAEPDLAQEPPLRGEQLPTGSERAEPEDPGGQGELADVTDTSSRWFRVTGDRVNQA